jgi:hypothetical protein
MSPCPAPVGTACARSVWMVCWTVWCLLRSVTGAAAAEPPREPDTEPLLLPAPSVVMEEAGPAAIVPAPDLAALEARLREELRAELRSQARGTWRPTYTPATDIAPPKGLAVYDSAKAGAGFPFAANIEGFVQVRWFEFARGATEWTDSAGVTSRINNINTFNINRFMLTPYGHVVNERLIWSLTLFGTTDNGRNASIVPLGYVGWKANDHLAFTAGTTFVAGTREWIISNRWVQGVDRSMANTFFRPSYSPGFQIDGDLLDGELIYRAGVWNSIQGATSGVLRNGTAMAWSGNVWWEPAGPFGLGYSDMEIHDEPAWRLGCSGLAARTEAIDSPGQNPEDTIVRLSDGTPVAVKGALGPGSQLTEFDFSLASVDAGWKYRGIALNFEYYFRMLDAFAGRGPFLYSSIYDQGGMAYAAWCVVPRRYEFYGRSSLVTGPFGTGQEYGGGFNHYLYGSRQSRFTVEALHILRSPADNIIYPYRAGYTGTAIQTQLVLIF